MGMLSEGHSLHLTLTVVCDTQARTHSLEGNLATMQRRMADAAARESGSGASEDVMDEDGTNAKLEAQLAAIQSRTYNMEYNLATMQRRMAATESDDSDSSEYGDGGVEESCNDASDAELEAQLAAIQAKTCNMEGNLATMQRRMAEAVSTETRGDVSEGGNDEESCNDAATDAELEAQLAAIKARTCSLEGNLATMQRRMAGAKCSEVEPPSISAMQCLEPGMEEDLVGTQRASDQSNNRAMKRQRIDHGDHERPVAGIVREEMKNKVAPNCASEVEQTDLVSELHAVDQMVLVSELHAVLGAEEAATIFAKVLAMRRAQHAQVSELLELVERQRREIAQLQATLTLTLTLILFLTLTLTLALALTLTLTLTLTLEG